jgi:hypothetical protein
MINDTSIKVQNGLEFILRHLAPVPHFPRNIMTYSLGRQVLVHSIEETMWHYRESEFLDCRISAFPPPPSTLSTKYLSNGLAPNLIMIDIDKSRFITEWAYKLAVSKIRKNIEAELGSSKPTVIWSGNGTHIIQPVAAVVLEELELFSPAAIGTNQPSVKFLRWAEDYLSSGKSDPAHTKTLSFGNCMLRVPGSHNSKCVNANNSVLSAKTEVKVIQEWDGHRPTIMLLIGSFHAYLVNQKLKQNQRDRQQQRRQYGTTSGIAPETAMISWIEKLLTMSIPDYRKYCIWRILAPYLINIRKLEDEQASHIIREWLDKCNSVKRVSFDEISRIRYDIQSVRKRGFYPIAWNHLKTENVCLYNILANYIENS